MDVDVKEQSQELARELGFSLSTVVNAQLREFIRSQKLSVQRSPRMTPVLEEVLGPIDADIAQGQNLSAPMRSSTDIDDWFENL